MYTTYKLYKYISFNFKSLVLYCKIRNSNLRFGLKVEAVPTKTNFFLTNNHNMLLQKPSNVCGALINHPKIYLMIPYLGRSKCHFIYSRWSGVLGLSMYFKWINFSHVGLVDPLQCGVKFKIVDKGYF